MGTKIKYLGTADVRVLKKGENFGGRLADPLESDVVWDARPGGNNHLVDADEAGLSPEAVALLCEDKESFKDVTELKRVPSSANEMIFRSAPKDRHIEVDAAGRVHTLAPGEQLDPAHNEGVKSKPPAGGKPVTL